MTTSFVQVTGITPKRNEAKHTRLGASYNHFLFEKYYQYLNEEMICKRNIYMLFTLFYSYN